MDGLSNVYPFLIGKNTIGITIYGSCPINPYMDLRSSTPIDMPQVVILAGGLGTRLGAITQHIPKSLVEVDDRPMISHILDWISLQGCDRALILTGHLGDKFEEYTHDSVSLTFVREPVPLGTGGALWNAVDFLEPEFLLVWGDDFHPILSLIHI